MGKIGSICLVVWFTGINCLWAQDSLPSNLQFNTYVKWLQAGIISSGQPSLQYGGLFHNRLMMRYTPDTIWTFDAAIRNRVLYGSLAPESAYAIQAFEADPGLLDLNFVPVRQPTLLYVMNIDRLWGQYRRGQWTVRAGRQRVNWSMTLVWNPNDWFNAWNFLDFDYEERPGADALRVQYQTGGFSQIEAVYSPARKANQSVGAFRVTGNAHGYDWQVLGGRYREKYALGTGWAGNIGQAGFKGEASVFIPEHKRQETAVALSMGLDRSFGSKWFVSGNVLVNSAGKGRVDNLGQLLNVNLAADNLMPGKLSVMAGANFALTPLATVSFNTLYSPNGNMILALPGISWSVEDNWVVDLTGQFFWLNGQEKSYNVLFLRAKWVVQ